MNTIGAVLLSLAMCGSASATIVNGSFEDGANPPSPGAFRTLEPGATDITGWTVTVHNVDWGTQGFASDGIRALDLNGNNGPGGVQQELSTIAGQRYRVGFDMNANTSMQAAVSLDVSAAGSLASYSYDPSIEVGGPWVAMAFEFTAVGPVTTLAFLSTTADQFFGPGLDNVSIQAIPEPDAVVVLAGFLALMGARRRTS